MSQDTHSSTSRKLALETDMDKISEYAGVILAHVNSAWAGTETRDHKDLQSKLRDFKARETPATDPSRSMQDLLSKVKGTTKTGRWTKRSKRYNISSERRQRGGMSKRSPLRVG
jgi:hypothetical protein